MKNIFRMMAMGLVLTAAAVRAEEAQPRQEAMRKELVRWQGTWQVETVEEDGQKTAVGKLRGRTIFFGGDAFIVKEGDTVVQMGTQTLDPSKNPPLITAVVREGQHKGETMLGIYEFKGDTLRVCFDIEGQKRPTDFKPDSDGAQFLAVYKRHESVEERDIDIAGRYIAESSDVGGGRQRVAAIIERRGDAYLVTFQKDSALIYLGVGIRSGGTFSLCWANRGQAGLSVYQIEKGPHLIGNYTTLGGIGSLLPEVLTFVGKEE